jgi:hypothetical protein
MPGAVTIYKRYALNIKSDSPIVCHFSGSKNRSVDGSNGLQVVPICGFQSARKTDIVKSVKGYSEHHAVLDE